MGLRWSRMLIFTLKSILGQETSWEFLTERLPILHTLGTPINMNSLTTSLIPYRLQLVSYSCDRSALRVHPALPQRKTPSLRRGSGKRSAWLSTVPSADTFGATWPNRERYDLGFLWGLWLMVAVQNIIHSAPRGCPAASAS